MTVSAELILRELGQLPAPLIQRVEEKLVELFQLR